MNKSFHYLSIIKHIKDGISSGFYLPGAKIPSQSELVKMFNVSKAPVIKALDVLIGEELLYSVKGKGVFVQDKKSFDDKNENGFNEIALLIPFFSDYYRDFVYSMEESFTLKGYSLRLYISEYKTEREKTLLENISTDPKVKGFLISPEAKKEKMAEFYPEILKSISKPFLAVNRRIPNTDFDFVEYDYLSGASLLGAHLAETGCRKIFFWGTHDDNYAWEDRFKGLKQGFCKYGGESKIEIFPANFSPAAIKVFAKALKELEPDAVVCSMDPYAVSIMDVLSALGLSVPEDISLAAFDNRDCSRLTTPQLTTVGFDCALAGRIASTKIIDKIEDADFKKINMLMEPRLYKRSSCKENFEADGLLHQANVYEKDNVLF